MAKILHIANFNHIKTKGCFQNSTQQKISNGLIRNGHQVINYSDRDMCRMFGFGSMNIYGRKKVNKHLLKFCESIEPDGIVIGHADTIDLRTLLKIKELFPHIKILEWNVDSIAISDDAKSNRDALYNLKKIKLKQEAVDVLLISTADRRFLNQLKTGRNKVGYLPNIVDNSIETGKSFKEPELSYDLFFSCNPMLKRQFCGVFRDIEKICEEIILKVSGLKVLYAGVLGYPKLSGSHYQKAMIESTMGFNLSHINDAYLYSSDRLAHMIGNGLLVFVDRRTGFGDIFKEDEMAFYETPEELYEKLNYFKNNPEVRMEHAYKGYEKYYSLFNEQKIGKYISDLLFDTFSFSSYSFPSLI